MQELICSWEVAVKKTHAPQKQMQVSMGVKGHGALLLDLVRRGETLGVNSTTGS